MDCNIILIGMSAVGKTTIGNLLSEKLDRYTLIDIDGLIERTEGLKISQIFEKFSDLYFKV